MLTVHIISDYSKPQLNTMVDVAEELQLKYDIVTGFSKEESFIGAEIAGKKDFLPIPINGKKIILAVMKELKRAEESGVDNIDDISAIFEKWFERYERHNAKNAINAHSAPEKAPVVQTPKEAPIAPTEDTVAPVKASVEELSVIACVDINNSIEESSEELDTLINTLSKENFLYEENEAFELEDSLYLSANVGNKKVFSNLNFYNYNINIIEKVVIELGAFLRSKDNLTIEEIESFFSKQNKEIARSVNN